ncbi:MAG: hypothetical protein IJF17_10760 [Thermoguttaceae bacterium]|nr:hypothetical protein [Thermoguttaceae bacterium]
MKFETARIWNDENGVLTFEWILLLTVLVIGIVGGLSAVRDAYIDELGDSAEAMASLDHSYFINAPLQAAIYDELTFPHTGLNVVDKGWISGSANASFDGQSTWTYYPSQYLDEPSEVTRFRPEGEEVEGGEGEGEGGTTGGVTGGALGKKPSQTVVSKSSVPGE